MARYFGGARKVSVKKGTTGVKGTTKTTGDVTIKKRGRIIYGEKGQPIGKVETKVSSGGNGSSSVSQKATTTLTAEQKQDPVVQQQVEQAAQELDVQRVDNVFYGTLADYAQTTGTRLSGRTLVRSGSGVELDETKTAGESLRQIRKAAEPLKPQESLVIYSDQKQRQVSTKSPEGSVSFPPENNLQTYSIVPEGARDAYKQAYEKNVMLGQETPSFITDNILVPYKVTAPSLEYTSYDNKYSNIFTKNLGEFISGAKIGFNLKRDPAGRDILSKTGAESLGYSVGAGLGIFTAGAYEKYKAVGGAVSTAAYKSPKIWSGVQKVSELATSNIGKTITTVAVGKYTLGVGSEAYKEYKTKGYAGVSRVALKTIRTTTAALGVSKGFAEQTAKNIDDTYYILKGKSDISTTKTAKGFISEAKTEGRLYEYFQGKQRRLILYDDKTISSGVAKQLLIKQTKTDLGLSKYKTTTAVKAEVKQDPRLIQVEPSTKVLRRPGGRETIKKSIRSPIKQYTSQAYLKREKARYGFDFGMKDKVLKDPRIMGVHYRSKETGSTAAIYIKSGMSSKDYISTLTHELVHHKTPRFLFSSDKVPYRWRTQELIARAGEKIIPKTGFITVRSPIKYTVVPGKDTTVLSSYDAISKNTETIVTKISTPKGEIKTGVGGAKFVYKNIQADTGGIRTIMGTGKTKYTFTDTGKVTTVLGKTRTTSDKIVTILDFKEKTIGKKLLDGGTAKLSTVLKQETAKNIAKDVIVQVSPKMIQTPKVVPVIMPQKTTTKNQLANWHLQPQCKKKNYPQKLVSPVWFYCRRNQILNL